MQEAPPQLHAPALQVCPAAQVPQAFPAEPHALVDWLAVGRHVSALQQPFEHEAGVHVHVPRALQACPGAHAAHAAPPLPHLLAGWLPLGTQVVPSQQPFGHEAASQTHLPLLHSWPAAQATHAPPPEPQAVVVDVTQVAAAEQQPVQAAPPQEHAWLSHPCPAAHVLHSAPPLPHAVGAVPRAHLPFESQQPCGQLEGPHVGPASTVESVPGGGLLLESLAGAESMDASRSTVPPSDASPPSGLSFGGATRQPTTTNAIPKAKTPNVPRRGSRRCITTPPRPAGRRRPRTPREPRGASPSRVGARRRVRASAE